METRPDGAPLMVCKYCLLYELGHCRKHNPMKNEPRHLRMANDTLLDIIFDCKNCEMQIWEHKQ